MMENGSMPFSVTHLRKKGATIVRFFVTQSSWVLWCHPVSSGTRTKCRPQQNCSLRLFFLKAASLEGRHCKARLGLKRIRRGRCYKHLKFPAIDFSLLTSVRSWLHKLQLPCHYGKAGNEHVLCMSTRSPKLPGCMRLTCTYAKSCSTNLVASVAPQTSNPPGLVGSSASVMPCSTLTSFPVTK